MKRFVLGAVALFAMGSAATVRAADLPYYPPPPRGPAPYAAPYTVNQPFDCYSWAGPYLGGNLGYAWGNVGNNPAKPSGFVGGVQAGYNWQNGGGPWVFGIEGDLQTTGADDTFAPWKFSNPWFGTVRGRAGYTFNNIMFYGTAGLAFGELRGETFGLSETHSSAGWTVGVGTEFGLGGFGLAPNWSAKIEYLYVDLSENYFTTTGASNGFRFGVVRAGINYHF